MKGGERRWRSRVVVKNKNPMEALGTEGNWKWIKKRQWAQTPSSQMNRAYSGRVTTAPGGHTWGQPSPWHGTREQKCTVLCCAQQLRHRAPRLRPTGWQGNLPAFSVLLMLPLCNTCKTIATKIPQTLFPIIGSEWLTVIWTINRFHKFCQKFNIELFLYAHMSFLVFLILPNI